MHAYFVALVPGTWVLPQAWHPVEDKAAKDLPPLRLGEATKYSHWRSGHRVDADEMLIL